MQQSHYENDINDDGDYDENEILKFNDDNDDDDNNNQGHVLVTKLKFPKNEKKQDFELSG